MELKATAFAAKDRHDNRVRLISPLASRPAYHRASGPRASSKTWPDFPLFYRCPGTLSHA